MSPRGPKRLVRLDPKKIAALLSQINWTVKVAAAACALSDRTFGKVTKGQPISYGSAAKVADKWDLQVSDLILASTPDETPVVRGTPLDGNRPLTIWLADRASRIVTGDMVVMGGNWKADTPFAFILAFHLQSSVDISIVGINCQLFKERRPMDFAPGRTYEDYAPGEPIPTRIERDWAWNQTPGPIIAGGHGIYGSGDVGGRLVIDELKFHVDGGEWTFEGDCETISKPLTLLIDRPVLIKYARRCQPLSGESPGKYTERPTVECALTFVADGVKGRQAWLIDFDGAGRGTIRQGDEPDNGTA